MRWDVSMTWWELCSEERILRKRPMKYWSERKWIYQWFSGTAWHFRESSELGEPSPRHLGRASPGANGFKNEGNPETSRCLSHWPLHLRACSEFRKNWQCNEELGDPILWGKFLELNMEFLYFTLTEGQEWWYTGLSFYSLIHLQPVPAWGSFIDFSAYVPFAQTWLEWNLFSDHPGFSTVSCAKMKWLLIHNWPHGLILWICSFPSCSVCWCI
jgi:hypothetical protein